jgi:hypothetical protein
VSQTGRPGITDVGQDADKVGIGRAPVRNGPTPMPQPAWTIRQQAT